MFNGSCYQGDGRRAGVGGASPPLCPTGVLMGFPTRRCFWAVVLLALAMSLLASLLHVDITMLTP